MANKKKGKVIQMLSPENYIKQRGRTLPIFECWINEDWQQVKLANVSVARKHKNGNYTVGLFLVDLNCRGVSDSFYHFNISPVEYRELNEDLHEFMVFSKIDYLLAHNIIFAGLEYADDLGFKPHKNFSVAQYLLEEDTDDIELIEIECGFEGQPLYIRGDNVSEAEKDRILKQLEQVCGPGNFDYLDLENFNESDFDEEVDFDEEFSEEEMTAMLEMIENSDTLQFKIQLKNSTKPAVWRRISVPSYFNFHDLHVILQIAFGWEDAHLFQFSPQGFGSFPVITMKEELGKFSMGEKRDAEDVELSEIFSEKQKTFTYIYDFGDDWVHSITLEKIIPEVSLVPMLIAGKGRCPFEDCGGSFVYQEIKKILSDQNHPKYQETHDMFCAEDETFDPRYFDIEQHRQLLERYFEVEDDDYE